jgi:hypothetical protein
MCVELERVLPLSVIEINMALIRLDSVHTMMNPRAGARGTDSVTIGKVLYTEEQFKTEALVR